MGQTAESIEKSLLSLLGGQADPKRWAKSVQRLSNHYVSEPDSVSPWVETWAREALLSYYHPLNQSRAHRVATKGTELGFFDGLNSIIDLGCGSAAASLGFLQALRAEELKAQRDKKTSGITSLELIDHSFEITQIAKKIAESSGLSPKEIKTSQQSLELLSGSDSKNQTLLILSYVLTEAHSIRTLEQILKKRPDIQAVAILEPSTSQDGRKLQMMREPLQSLGFHIWAPCTHAGQCPLLKDSDRDWCHDRLVPETPTWWQSLEAELPMKNKTVTVSYLLARRSPRPSLTKGSPDITEVRVIGDRMEEKTKVRQMICRGENREFISWFPSRLGGAAENFELARGDRFLADQSAWNDARGIDRSKEFRLSLEAIEKILRIDLNKH